MWTTRKHSLLKAVWPVFLLVALILLPAKGYARKSDDELRYTNEETGYEVYLRDEEDLLSDSEERKLVSAMKPITAYGGVAFASVSSSNAAAMAKSLYREWFGTDSGTLFLIDMGDRQLRIFSDGRLYRTVTNKYANLITDNIYREASAGHYYECAKSAFEQELTILEGGRIAQPMRHISSVLAALVLGLLGNFLYVWMKKKLTRDIVKEGVLVENEGVDDAVTIANEKVVKSTRTKHSSGSSGGGSSRGGGGFSGGGGGFSSGGGGGHGF